MEYTCFDFEIKDKIAHIKMSRPDEFNSMNKALVRVASLSGKHL